MARTHPTEESNAALAGAVGRPRTVLDVGAGSGASARAALEAGARVTAVEGDPDLAARARRAVGEVIEVDPLDRAQVAERLAERRFDLILMPDLLERTDAPAEVLRDYAALLEPGGRVVFSVRNRDAWPLRVGLPPAEFGFAEPPRRRYSLDELRELVAEAGLQLLHLDPNPLLLRAALPGLLAFQHVVVARRPPEPGPLSLTVGMLTMDEEPSIAPMIERIREVAPDARILCVDSSVRDQTPAIAERMGARVLRQLPPRGHGPAMELLMVEASAQSDALVYLDCDFTYPPEVIPALRRILESGVDVVNAARTRRRPEAMPLPNYLANRSFARLAHALNGMPVADLHSGMRGYRSSVIRSFAFDGRGDALPIDTLLWPARCGYRVVEVPIDYQERVGVSKLRKVAGTVWTFVRLARTLAVGRRRLDTYEVWPSLEG